MKKITKDDDELKEAVKAQLKDIRGKDRSEEERKEIAKIHKDEIDLDFMLDIEGINVKEKHEIESVIVREIYKTSEQKKEDFKNHNPNLPMIYGGKNDVFQAVMQCLASLTHFIGYFMKDHHLNIREHTSKRRPLTMKIAKVYEMLWRSELQYTVSFINIKFFGDYMRQDLGFTGSKPCGVNYTKTILQMISAETVSQELV